MGKLHRCRVLLSVRLRVHLMRTALPTLDYISLGRNFDPSNDQSIAHGTTLRPEYTHAILNSTCRSNWRKRVIEHRLERKNDILTKYKHSLI